MLSPITWVASDKWSRDLEFTLPVADPDKWENVHDKVNQLLHFLTADYWSVDFVKREQELNIPNYEIKNISVDSYKVFATDYYSIFCK